MQQFFDEALKHHQAGRLAEAEPLYVKLMDAGRSYPLLHLFGLLRLQQGQVEAALALMEEALALQPGAVETLANYALALDSAGRTAQALGVMDKLVAQNADDGRRRNNRGGMRYKLGGFQAALADFDAALAREPRYLEAFNNRGLCLLALHRYEEARENYDRALALMPNYVDARVNRGLAWRGLGRQDEAAADFEGAVKIAPHHVGAWINQAAALWSLGRIDEALACYSRALALDPNQPDALAGRGELRWARKKELAPAIADLEQALRLAPDLPYARGNLLQMKLYAADWRDFAAQKTLIDEGVRAGKPVVEPFIYQGISDDSAALKACAVAYAAAKFPAQPPLKPALAPRAGKIRIGYLCGEFRAQATAYLSAGLYEAHDRSRFEVIGFDNSLPDGSAMRARLEAAFDKMVDIAPLSDAAAGLRIAEEEIDILVNLNGYFGRLRMGVFARRPAPIQVNYLGFPGTLGASCMDYILADRSVIGEEEHGFFSEEVVYLPHSYQINDDKRAVPEPPPPRAALGLPEDGFVFCHFNYGYKIVPEMFALWMRLLGQVPGSVLWLLQTHPLFVQNTRAAAARAGIDPARLVFAPEVPVEEHLARLGAGDLFLDSLPCGAHTTASDALWAGLPLLTCRGNSFAGRVAASLLAAAKLPELVTENLKDYAARALALAGDPEMLKALRVRLAAVRDTPLFDTRASTRAVEAAYETMIARRQKEVGAKENGAAMKAAPFPSQA